MADESRLSSAFYNLTHNAIAELPPQGAITIHGELDAATESVLIQFQDTGPGMPAEIRDSLFTPGAISRKVGGTGLGMKITRMRLMLMAALSPSRVN